MKTPNYTLAQVDQIINSYEAGESVEAIADTIGKSVRSVRSKLVREGVYQPVIKSSTKKVLGPTKKELLRVLETHIDVTGLEGATKEAIENLIAKFTDTE